jgi:glycosyltransferase involved in cell wall biosynthesis
MVSVIIPNYNHADYLKQRIDSVLNQTYSAIEVIILDDRSTDNSKEIIEQYRGNEKISRIVYNTENSGSTFKQWDKGIQLAKGEYVWIAESDDWCEPVFLETIISGLEKKPDCVFGYCQSFCVNDKEEIIFQSNHNKLEGYYSNSEFLEKFLTFGNAVFNASMTVFRKRFYYDVSDFFRSFRFTGDWIFWAELSRLGSVYVNARPLNYFRKHDQDVSSKMYTTGLNFKEEIKALNYFHEQLKLNDALYLKARIKLYSRFLTGNNKMENDIKREVKPLFFNNDSFMKKQYFLLLSYLYRLKMNLNKKINTSFSFKK